MAIVNAYAVKSQGKELEPFTYDLDEIGHDEVDIKVAYCGLCHSDVSMINGEWGETNYPLVPGHEVVGTVEAIGSHVSKIKIGDTVGLGWYAGSCEDCMQCLAGDHNLCHTNEQTIVDRHGGFADKVRCKELWAIPLPKKLNLAKAGPLFCGGTTVFNPIVQFTVKPTDKVAVIGIGGLGHLAIQFLNKWGCEVTAFTSHKEKETELKHMGAHYVANSTDSEEMKKFTGKFNFILNTANVSLDWQAFVNCLAPKGNFVTVGAVLEPIALSTFPMITDQRSYAGSGLGSPATTKKMLEFCARHNIEAITEEFPLEKINDAIKHLESGKARYRIVLKN